MPQSKPRRTVRAGYDLRVGQYSRCGRHVHLSRSNLLLLPPDTPPHDDGAPLAAETTTILYPPRDQPKQPLRHHAKASASEPRGTFPLTPPTPPIRTPTRRHTVPLARSYGLSASSPLPKQTQTTQAPCHPNGAEARRICPAGAKRCYGFVISPVRTTRDGNIARRWLRPATWFWHLRSGT
jgi:hypothetical protein